LFAARRIFWPLTVAGQEETADHWQMAFETTAVPEREDREGRVVMNFEKSQTFDAHLSGKQVVQDWDELSGRLCIRSARSRFPQDVRRRTTWRVTLVDFV
jgi:hypothetical protein